MKKLYLLLIVLLCGGALSAQTRLISTHNSKHDGTKYVPTDSATITYAANNNNHGGNADYNLNRLKFTENIRISYNPTDMYYAREKRDNEYDANNNLTKQTIQRPHPNNTSPMVNNSQQLFEYDSKNNKTLDIVLTWSKTSSKWDSLSKHTYAYDANNNLLVDNHENFVSNAFRGVLRKNYVYDANNNNTVYWTEVWQTSIPGYDTFNRNIFTYDVNGKNDTILFQSFNKTTRQWENTSRATYTFTNGLQTGYIHAYWRNGQWENGLKYETFFDAQKKVTHNHYNKWDKVNKAWIKDTKDTIINISTTPLVRDVVYSSWDAAKMAYINTSKNSSKHNSDGYTTETVIRTWEATNSQWIIGNNNDSTIFRYEGTTTTNIANNKSSAPRVTLYPNPSNGNTINLQISGNNNQPYTVAIYNLQGQLLLQQKVANGAAHKTIPTVQLNNGQYILTIKTAESKTTQQFSVLR